MLNMAEEVHDVLSETNSQLNQPLGMIVAAHISINHDIAVIQQMKFS